MCHPSTNPLLDAATRWDAKAYVDIAHDGYGAVPANNAYFPLYPFLIRVLATIFGGSGDAYFAAGVLISNVALLVALIYLASLVAIDHDAAAGTRAALYLLVFPTSVFLAVVYPESLLIALSIGAVYHARRGQWLPAAALGALAALTRPFIGAAVALPLAIEAYRRSGLRAALAAAAPAAVALVGWLVVLWRITGDPKAILTAEAFHVRSDVTGRHIVAVPHSTPEGTMRIRAFRSESPLSSWASVQFGPAAATRVNAWRPSLAAYATVVFLISVATGSLTSSPRYYLSVFPAFMVLALVARGWTGLAYVAVGATISVIFTAMYALWYWVA